MEYFVMIITIIIVFPPAFLAAVKLKPKIPPNKRILTAVIIAMVLLTIFAVIPLLTTSGILFGSVGLGFTTASLLAILLGLTGPFKQKG